VPVASADAWIMSAFVSWRKISSRWLRAASARFMSGPVLLQHHIVSGSPSCRLETPFPLCMLYVSSWLSVA